MTKKTKSSSPLLTILKWFGIILTAFTLLYYVLLLIVPLINPSRIRIISWVGLTMPFAIAAMFAWLVLWIVTRQRALYITLAAVMLLSLPVWRRTLVVNIGGNYPSRQEIASGRQLRIMTYNVEMFQHYKQDDNVIKFIEEGDYDIVCMQEYGHIMSKESQWVALNKRLSLIFPYRHIWFKNQSRRNENGLVLYSRFPIVNKVKINYNSRFNLSVYSDIVVDGDTIRIINNHLESNRLTYNDRDVADKFAYDYRYDKSTYRSLRTVLRKIADASIIRSSQVDSIAAVVSQTPYPVIILGDFNDVPQSYAYHRLADAVHLGATSSMTDAYVTAGDWFYYYTFNQDHLNVPIDHILVSPEFSVQECSIHELDYSDHYPVTTTILLRHK